MYIPSDEILQKYADVFIRFALHGGKGVKPGEVVYCLIPEWARPIYIPLQTAILKAGAHPLMRLMATGVDRDFYELASDAQLAYFPERWQRGLVDTIDHRLAIKPFETPHGLEGIAPAKLMARANANQPLGQWLNDKEAAGKLSWTLGFWGTQEYADEAGMTLEEYWEQIIKACYLDQPDPVQSWRDTFAEIERLRHTLNAMAIKRLHMTAVGTDFWVTIGEKRSWRGGTGRNIPSFEIFTSPDYRFTQGTIAFSQPLFYNGYKIEDIRLRFVDGSVVESHASKNEAVLAEMIAQTNVNHIGEFSLTDGRLSHIEKLMCNTLFDENIGGPEGNTHIALGMSYKDTFDGDPATLAPEDWEVLGFNDVNCPIHTDIISTSTRTVEAELPSGDIVTIYEKGQFTI